MRSRNIQDYFCVMITELKPDTVLAFDVHLYFTRNQHLLIWRHQGDIPSADFIRKYLARGVQQVWIHKEDEAAYRDYKNPPVKAGSEEGKFLGAVLKAPTLTEEQRKSVLAEVGKELMSELGAAATPEEQSRANKKIQQTVREALSAIASEASQLVAQYWKLSDTQPELEHAINVASYSVVFAMAFGRMDQEVIADLALAGLLHDLGVAQIEHGIARTPYWKLADADKPRFHPHVDYTLKLITQHAPNTSARARAIIGQHHEKFAGGGYPQGLGGFKLDDLAQLVALADLVDELSLGYLDGSRRTLSESLEQLQKLESRKNFPVYFNPEVFSAVMAWTQRNLEKSANSDATGIVADQAQQILKARPS